MARQKGIIKLKGTIGDITFYKTQDGHLAREKGGIDASRIASDPAFQRTRENGSEFGRAGKAGKLLRTAFRPLLLNSADGRMVSRLTQRMVKVIQADLVSDRGLRNVIDGEAELLFGFEFNIRGKLGTSLFAPYVATIDRAAGEIKVDLASFIPANMIAAPSGTTHFKMVMGAAEVDFANETSVFESAATAVLPYDNADTAAIDLSASVTANSALPVIQVLGIEFYQEVNGAMYPLKNGSYNALSVIDVTTA